MILFEKVVKNIDVLACSFRTGSEFKNEVEVLANDLSLAILGNLLGV